MGLLEIPKQEVPPGGFGLEPCECEDADIEVAVERQLLSSKYVRDGTLIFNLEGYGRFRLEIARTETRPC